jgi:hypothetical protein
MSGRRAAATSMRRHGAIRGLHEASRHKVHRTTTWDGRPAFSPRHPGEHPVPQAPGAPQTPGAVQRRV